MNLIVSSKKATMEEQVSCGALKISKSSQMNNRTINTTAFGADIWRPWAFAWFLECGFMVMTELREDCSHIKRWPSIFPVPWIIRANLLMISSYRQRWHEVSPQYWRIPSLFNFAHQWTGNERMRCDWLEARLAVNSVTMGNYERPLAISRFVKELSNAFQILNLKNDNLRKRFDSIKYDVKKIEEGFAYALLRLL